jgi:hypothetical protein
VGREIREQCVRSCDQFGDDARMIPSADVCRRCAESRHRWPAWRQPHSSLTTSRMHSRHYRPYRIQR